MRYIGPQNRLARREGVDLGLKTPGTKSHANLLKRLNVPPGQHGARSRRKFSERGKQLREKQKLSILFGVTNKQLKNYFKEAMKKKGNTALYLVQLLEHRLDNIVYRLGFAPTRASARQLVNHGHIKVGDTIVTISSYGVKKGEEISFADNKSAKIPYIESIIGNKSIIIPKWLERKGLAGVLVDEPSTEEVERQLSLRDIVEYYSR